MRGVAKPLRTDVSTIVLSSVDAVSCLEVIRWRLQMHSVGLVNDYLRGTYEYGAGAARLGTVEATTARATRAAKRMMVLKVLNE